MELRKARLGFGRDRRGATAIEFAIVAAPFLALLLAGLQTGLVYLADSSLEVATEKASRTVLTGSVQGQTQAQFLSTVCSKLPAILKCANLMVDARVYTTFSGADTSTPTLTYDRSGNITNTWSYNLGGAGDIVVMRVLYLMPVIGGPLNFSLANAHGRHLAMATAVFKNEPYQ